MEPTSRGFSEVRDILFRELVEVTKNTVNDSSKEKLGEVSNETGISPFLNTLTLLYNLSSSFPAHGEDFHAGLPSCEDAELL